jgi:DMSO/TMAO reductase YedYZ heme-binding membrane subunit/nitrite reductase/ring-hydroxylating ferredoxin subunit
MAVHYVAVGWNRQKRIYDATLAAGILLYLALFGSLGAWLHPNATAETLLIRGLGTAAFLLLQIVLCIGPLCRLDRRFLPLLYNRRHLGVTTFLLGLGHGAFATFQFHALGDENPISSIFTAEQGFKNLQDLPFQPFGFAALLILFVMAATSHDFWLHNLGPVTWKRIHMLVYLAYALLVVHVAFGVLQSERSPALLGVLALAVATVLTLHLAAAFKERRVDLERRALTEEGFVEVCDVNRINENRAVIVPLSEERAAVFRYQGKISAVSNVCRHQNGPLGEGKIIDGCITCPWHGYQYAPETGASPPPFTDKVSTFRCKVVDRTVFIDPRPCPPGTFIEPARIEGREARG